MSDQRSTDRSPASPPDRPLPLPFPLLPALAIFAGCWTILAWPWLSGAVTIPWDAKSQFYPQQAFLARALAEGQSPFWTPNVFAGWPQIADPQSLIFSPLHLLLALAMPQPGFQAFDAVSFATLLLGGVGMILIFRDRGWHVAGALVAALAFAFGGSCAARLQHTGQIMSVAYLPLALWLLMRALERSSWGAGLAAGLAAALIALGRDQVALLALYLLAAFVLTHWLTGEGRRARLRASAKPLAAGALAGGLVVAWPLMLTALLAADSNRPVFDFVSAGRGSLHPAHLLTLAFADLYGAADPAIPYWGPPSFPWGPTDLFLAQNMGQLYAGAIPMVAIVVGGAVRGGLWSRDIRFFTIAAVVVLLYALGWYTPAFRAMYEGLPGIALFRRPADATFIFVMLLAVLGGYGVHGWLTASPLTRMQALLALAAGVATAAAATRAALSVGTIGVAIVPLLAGIGWGAAAVAVLAVARRYLTAPLAAALAVAAFMTLDLAWNNAPNESTGLPPGSYADLRPDTDDATVALLKRRLAADTGADRRDRVELIGIAYHWPNSSLVHGFDHVFGHNPLRLKAFARATGVGDTVAVADQRTFAPLFPSYRSEMADLFGLRLIATGVPVDEIDPKLKPGDLRLIERTGKAHVYENPRALPRVMLLTDWRQADFEALLRDGWPAGVDPRRTVLLEHAPPGIPTRTAEAAPSSVRLTRYANTEVTIEVDAPAGGLLLLNDAWHPWWRATVDGAPAEILKANVLFRAVALSPGRHTVRFEFRPFAGALDQLKAKFGISAARR